MDLVHPEAVCCLQPLVAFLYVRPDNHLREQLQHLGFSREQRYDGQTLPRL